MAAAPIEPISPADIQNGIRKREFFYLYQPRTSFSSGLVVGGEALLRWRRGERVLAPGEFIDIVARAGMSPTIFEHMVERIPEDLQHLKDKNLKLPISINVTPEDLKETGPAALLEELISAGEFRGRDIQIEVTESMVLVDDVRIRKSIKVLLDHGVDLLMDDFGTGYSSIDVLSRFPFACVKLDMGLVSRISSSLKTYRIVKAILSLARDLKIGTVAEGVQTLGEYDALQLMGCREAQGYYISPPLPLEEFTDFCINNRHMPRSTVGALLDAHRSLDDYRRAVVATAVCHFAHRGTEHELSITELDIEHDPVNSRFGRWFYGAGQAYKDLAVFEAIELAHARMRHTGMRLVGAAYRGRQDFGTILGMIVQLNNTYRFVDRQMANLTEAVLAQEELGRAAAEASEPAVAIAKSGAAPAA
jgi:EAL domain-containing protein (putative c-di-GMP-specific phosphodiesterase class I)